MVGSRQDQQSELSNRFRWNRAARISAEPPAEEGLAEGLLGAEKEINSTVRSTLYACLESAANEGDIQ